MPSRSAKLTVDLSGVPVTIEVWYCGAWPPHEPVDVVEALPALWADTTSRRTGT